MSEGGDIAAAGGIAAGDVGEALDDWCEHEVGAAVAARRWRLVSAWGAVTGVELADGRAVVVRTYSTGFGAGALGAVAEVRQHLASSWFPCAPPVAGPAPLGRGWATAERLIDDPGPVPVAERDLVSSAAGLARLVRYSDRVVTPTQLAALRPLAGRGGPAGAARSGVGELVATAEAARAADRSRPVVTHLDWSAGAVRADRYGVRAVFGFDRVALVPDAFGAGRAAVTWAVTTDDPQDTVPDPSRIGEFLDVYQQIRGFTFRPHQLRAAWGSALLAVVGAGSATVPVWLDRHGDEVLARISAAS